jgi:ERCC4-type nuclease
MKILIDTREQLPSDFTRYGAITERATLPVGDYSLPGFEDKVSIERKAIDDLISCLMGGRDRFERELAKGRYYDLFAVVIEGSMEDISHGRYRSNMKPQSALQSVFAFQVRYRVPFIWAGNRAGGVYATHSLLSKYLYEIEQRYKQATKALAAA